MRLLFIALSMALGLGVLGAAELGFRLAGYGGHAPVFTDAGELPGGSRLIFSSVAGSTAYFDTRRSSAGSLDPVAFEMPRPERAFRVMVIGESAAKGIPSPRPLAWSSILREMLGDLMPQREVEVLNIAVTAIAAFPASDILRQSLAQDPDLVVIWVGNNEFYGAYGVASLHSAGRTPRMMALIHWARGLGVVQWMDGLGARQTRPAGETLMEAMIGRSFIAPDDPVRTRAAENLRVLVGGMARRCIARGVPVVVCLPPVNERDLAPLGVSDVSGLDAGALKDVERSVGSALLELRSEPAAAESHAREAIARAPQHAMAHFLLGRALHAQGKSAEALGAFQRAIDLDSMPWRPPSTSVEAVRAGGERGGAVICDLHGAFRSGSPGGAVGWELVADHVHPSQAGQMVAARAVAGVIAAMPGASGWGVVGGAEGLADDAEYAARVGVNPYDAYGVDVAMRTLARIPFFRDSTPEFLSRTDGACRSFEQSCPPAVLGEIRAWESQGGVDSRRPIAAFAARGLRAMGRMEEAARMYRVARGCVTPYGVWELEYAVMELECREALGEQDVALAEAMLERGRFLVEHGRSTSGGAEWFTGRVAQLAGRHEEAVGLLGRAAARVDGPMRAEVDMALVDSLVALDERDAARAILERGASAGIDAYRARLAREFGE